MTRLLLLLATFLIAAELSSAASFWDNLRLDCAVSVWSDWGPTVNGYRTRTRQIYRQPQHGGAPCPNLSETDQDPWVEMTTAAKASIIQTNFLSRFSKSSSSRKRRQTVTDRDILFIVDSSGSIGSKDFRIARNNLADLIGKICGKIGLGKQQNRAALITFSTEPKEIFDFDTYDNLKDLQRFVRKLPRITGSTCSGKALEYAKTMFTSSKGMRRDRDSVKEVVVLTDGHSNCDLDVVLKARELQNSRSPAITIFAFAISNFTMEGRREIEDIASKPTSQHLFNFISFIKFEEVVHKILQHTDEDTCAPLTFG